MRTAPGGKALGVGEPGVQHGERRLREARGETPDELRGQADFGYEYEHAALPRQLPGRQAQVDLGLAAAGDAVQQPGVEPALVGSRDRLERSVLAGRRFRLRYQERGYGRPLRRRHLTIAAYDPAALAQRLGPLAPGGAGHI